MAQIDKLLVSGIRSFGPGDENIGVIKFFPVTIILGKNGSGKTTLIESLRYMASGEHPPGTNGGKTWIHNPQSAKASNIRAQVKLQFKDSHGVATTTTRSLELTIKKDRSGTVKSTLKSLDGIIKRDGSTLPTRCAEVDKEMLELLGASKAVLTNVIFCHQEDNTWPLSEGKALKEKFDQIFGSIGYVKALAKIKKVRDDKMKDLKGLSAEKALHNEYRTTLEKKQRELNRVKEAMDYLKTKKKQLDEQVKPLEATRSEIAKSFQEISNVSTKISEIKGKLQEKESSHKQLRKNIANLFDGSIDDLRTAIDSFDSATKKKLSLSSSLEMEIDEEEQKMKKSSSQLSELLVKRGKLEQAFDQNNRTWVDLKASVAKVYSSGLLDGQAPEFEENEMDVCLKTIKFLESKSSNLVIALESEINSTDSKIQTVEKLLDEAKMRKTKVEHTIQARKESEKRKSAELRDLKARLNQIDGSSSKLTDLEKLLQISQDKSNSLDKAFAASNFDGLLETINNKRQNLIGTKSSLDKELSIAQENSRRFTEYEKLVASQQNETATIKRIKEDHDHVFDRLSVTPSKSFEAAMKRKERNLKEALEEKQGEHSSLRSQIESSEAHLDVDENSLRKLQEDIKLDEALICRVVKEASFAELLDSTESELSDLREKYGSATGTSYLIKKQISDIKSLNQCPVCNRDFEKGSVMKTEALNALEKYLKNLPAEVEDTKISMNKKEKYLSELRDLKPIINGLETKKQTLAELRKSIERNTKAIKEIKPKVSVIQNELVSQETELRQYQAALPYAKQYDRALSELKLIERELLSVSPEVINMKCNPEELINKLRAVDLELSVIDEERETMNAKKNLVTRELNEVKSEVNRLQSEKLALEKNQQERTALVAKMTELQKEIDSLSKDDGSVQDLESKNNQILGLEKEKIAVIRQKDSTQRSQRTETDKIQLAIDKLKGLEKEIVRYEQSSLKPDFEKTVEKINSMEEQTKNAKAKVSKLRNDFKKVEDEISNTKTRRRELDDNLQLLELENEIKRLRVKLDEIEGSVTHTNHIQLETRRMEVEKEHQKLINELGVINGQMSSKQDIQRDIESEMRREQIRDSEKTYKKAVVNHLTLELLCDDLNKYYKALDKAVSTYHVRKMQEINVLIDHFWKQTYQSSDIQTIKIVCDDSEERTADKRKTFNYRVVMVVDGVDMDMRGRCSAGQKVLASIVIRIALAQIFCIKCGVIALDEPTTNLDEATIHSLARTIANIAEDQQGRIQLIIITHDKEFLSCLGEENEHYYEVFKNEEGFSRIQRRSINEID